MEVNDPSTSPRQALFSDVSSRTLKVLESLPGPTPLVLLTGGLRTPALLYSALASQHSHLLGIGRGSVLCPDLPTILRDKGSNDHEPFAPEPSLSKNKSQFWTWLPKVKLIGAGLGMAWYIVGIRRLALLPSDERISFDDIGGVEAVLRMWLWIGYNHVRLGPFAVMGFCVLAGIAILWFSIS
jgi:hypothetical protein